MQHSYGPSLGVKADAVPGRINQVKFICQRPGIFLGSAQKFVGLTTDLYLLCLSLSLELILLIES